jgi:hypothetical protein
MALTTFTEEETLEFGWWLEIVTALPGCTYYFKDLKKEGAKGLTLQIKQYQP